jgi:AcrR family transcriptional regulator
MSTTLTRKEKRTLARRNQILDAAAKVFAENGFQKSTTREIAEAADISEGTIYNYFENKDDLLLSLLDRITDTQGRPSQYEDMLEDDFEEATIELATRRIQAMGQDYETFLAVLPEILANPDLRERYRRQILDPIAEVTEKHIRQRIERGEVRAIDPALFTRFAMCLNQGMLVMLMLGDPVMWQAWEDREKFAEDLVRFMFEGIRPDEPE